MSRELPPRRMSVTRQIVLLGAVLNVSYLATCIHKSSRVYLFQQAQCLNYYQANDPTKVDSHYHVEEALCKIHEVQSPLSILDGIDSFLQNLPGKATPSSLRCSASTLPYAKTLPIQHSILSEGEWEEGRGWGRKWQESSNADMYHFPQ